MEGLESVLAMVQEIHTHAAYGEFSCGADWEDAEGSWPLEVLLRSAALLSSRTDCGGREIRPGDQWAAKQMTWIRTGVSINFLWTGEGRWSMASSLYHLLTVLLLSPLSLSSPASTTTTNLSLCKFSTSSQNQTSAVAVVRAKTSNKAKCHSAALPSCRKPLVWFIHSGCAVSRSWAHKNWIPTAPYLSHIGQCQKTS